MVYKAKYSQTRSLYLLGILPSAEIKPQQWGPQGNSFRGLVSEWLQEGIGRRLVFEEMEDFDQFRERAETWVRQNGARFWSAEKRTQFYSHAPLYPTDKENIIVYVQNFISGLLEALARKDLKTVREEEHVAYLRSAKRANEIALTQGRVLDITNEGADYDSEGSHHDAKTMKDLEKEIKESMAIKRTRPNENTESGANKKAKAAIPPTSKVLLTTELPKPATEQIASDIRKNLTHEATNTPAPTGTSTQPPVTTFKNRQNEKAFSPLFLGSDDETPVSEASHKSVANATSVGPSLVMPASTTKTQHEQLTAIPARPGSDKNGPAVQESEPIVERSADSIDKLYLPTLSKDQQSRTHLFVRLENESYFEVITLEKCLTFETMRSAILTASGYNIEDRQFIRAIIFRFTRHSIAANVNSIESHRMMLIRIDAWHKSKERSMEHGICDILVELLFDKDL